MENKVTDHAHTMHEEQLIHNLDFVLINPWLLPLSITPAN